MRLKFIIVLSGSIALIIELHIQVTNNKKDNPLNVSALLKAEKRLYEYYR